MNRLPVVVVLSLSVTFSSCKLPSDLQLEFEGIGRVTPQQLPGVVGNDSELAFFRYSVDKEPLLVAIRSSRALEALSWSDRRRLGIVITNCVQPQDELSYAGLGLYRGGVNVLKAPEANVVSTAGGYIYYVVLLVKGGGPKLYDLARNPSRVCIDLRWVEKPFVRVLRSIEIPEEAIRSAVGAE